MTQTMAVRAARFFGMALFGEQPARQSLVAWLRRDKVAFSNRTRFPSQNSAVNLHGVEKSTINLYAPYLFLTMAICFSKKPYNSKSETLDHTSQSP